MARRPCTICMQSSTDLAAKLTLGVKSLCTQKIHCLGRVMHTHSFMSSRVEATQNWPLNASVTWANPDGAAEPQAPVSMQEENAAVFSSSAILGCARKRKSTAFCVLA